MDEHGLRELLGDVKRGRLTRRDFVTTMVAFGLTAPLAAQLLAHAGVAEPAPRSSRSGAAAAAP